MPENFEPNQEAAREAESSPGNDVDSRESATGEGAEAAPPSELEIALAERDAAIAEKNEVFERYQRAQAEFENIRKRLQRDHEEFREYAAVDTIEALLPIVDDFERAIAAPGIDPDVLKGLVLIHDRILDVFQRAGLKTVEDGGKFDPHLHQAVDRASAESDADDQKILETYRRGYQFKDRLIRAAMVKVAVKD